MNDEMNAPMNNEGGYTPNTPLETEMISTAPKRRSKKWVILIPVVTLTVVLIAVCTTFLLSYLTTSPFQRTMETVFPSLEVLFDMQDKGTVTVDANIGNDLADNLKSEPLHVKAQYGYNKKYTKSVLSFGHDENMVGAEFLYDDDRLEISSPDLIGKDRYYVELDGLKKALDKSVFAPQSGSDYALSDEYYNLIKQALDDRKQNEKTVEILTEVIQNILSDLEGELTVETSTETVDLLSGKTKAKVSTVKIDEDFLLTAINALLNEWETNGELRELGEDWWKNAGLKDADLSLDQFVKDAVHNYKEAITQAKPKLVIRYAECNGYFVFAEITVSAEQKNEKNEFEKADIRFTWTFHKNPSKNSDFEITVDYMLGQEKLMELCVVYDREDPKKSESFALTAMLNSYADNPTSSKLTLTSDLEDDGTWKLSLNESEARGFGKIEDARYTETTNIKFLGSYQRTSRAVKLTFDKITGEFEHTPIKIDKTKVSLTLSESGPWVKMIRRPKDLTSLTESDIKKLDEQIHKKLNPLAGEINRGLGINLLEYQSIVDEPSTVEFTYGSTAYDPKTQRVFLLESKKKEIVVYNALTMQKVGTISLPQNTMVPLLVAESGRLLLANTIQKKAYLYDASTLKQIKQVSLPEAPNSIGLDGKYILSYSYDSGTVYHFNMDTDDYRRLDTCKNPAMIVMAPENHVAMVCESGYSYQSSQMEYDVAFFNTETGKAMKRASFSNNTIALPDYNGYAFTIGTKMFSTSGATISSQSLPIKHKNSILHYFYVDDHICMTLESSDGYIGSYVYVDGEQVAEIPDLSEYGKIIRLADGKYLVIRDSEISSSHNYISVLRVKKAWRFGVSLWDLPETE